MNPHVSTTQKQNIRICQFSRRNTFLLMPSRWYIYQIQIYSIKPLSFRINWRSSMNFWTTFGTCNTFQQYKGPEIQINILLLSKEDAYLCLGQSCRLHWATNTFHDPVKYRREGYLPLLENNTETLQVKCMLFNQRHNHPNLLLSICNFRRLHIL